jgi:predicted alpha/beta hydrolase
VGQPAGPQAIAVLARDGRTLAADLFLPGGAPRAAVLVAGAMGVPRGYYAPFAAHLASRGVAALTLDYRGIGGSRDGPLRGARIALHDWAEQDLAGALDALAARFAGAPLLWVGHSVGGQLLGIAADERVAGALLVGAQSGYWRIWPGARRLAIAALWHVVIPAVVPALGRLPAALLGGGEDIPPGVAREWAAWGRQPEYVRSWALRERGGGLAFARWRGALRCYAVSDDGYAPVPTVRALAGFFERARVEVKVVHPRDAGVHRIGHFGFFRRRFEASLWEDAAGWLLGVAEGRPPPSLPASAEGEGRGS